MRRRVMNHSSTYLILCWLGCACIRDVSCFPILPLHNRNHASTSVNGGRPCRSAYDRTSERLHQTKSCYKTSHFDRKIIVHLSSLDLDKDYGDGGDGGDNDNYEEDFDDDDFDDDDDDDDDGENEKFQITDSKDTPLPPLPSFYDDDDDDFMNKSGWTASSNAPAKTVTKPPVADTDDEKENSDVITTVAPSTTPTATSSSSVEDETQKRIEQQQEQIDLLMKLVQSQTASSVPESPSSQQQGTPPTTAQSQQQAPLPPLPPLGGEISSVVPTAPTSMGINVAPLKAMMFIDGTWLYYTLYGRREQDCPITRKFGRGWTNRYKFDWSALPRIVCEQMQAQQISQGWSSSTNEETPRPVEIVRASVFTSMKNDTNPHSFRVKMFEDMEGANYDIHMMETVGKGEKCVDIQLAVEMLHYATVPHSYDVAILLSGDKDFMPALIRTRQKGRKVGIVSMRSWCNRALYETPNARDYEVIWIEKYLDQLVVPLSESDVNDKQTIVSRFTLNKVLFDFIEQSGVDCVSSRDVGLYLKLLKIGDRTFLDEIKSGYGGLFQFLARGRTFTVVNRDQNRDQRKKTISQNDKSYWISLAGRAKEYLIEDAKQTKFHPDEKRFFKSYSSERLGQDTKDGTRESAYFHTVQANDPSNTTPVVHNYGSSKDVLTLPDDLVKDYSVCKVVELKERCRKRGLPISGVKAAILERVQKDVEEQIEKLKEEHEAKSLPKLQQAPNDVTKYLEELVCEYLKASGGVASSRDVGRYLAANSASKQTGRRETALAELKRTFGGLSAFLNLRGDLFERQPGEGDANDYSFQIALKQNAAKLG